MPVNLSIKNVPDEVARGLRNRAVRNQRSLQHELLDILRQAAKDQAPVTIDVLLEQTQRKKPALDETASRVLAAQDAEHERAAQRFEDLIDHADDPTQGERPG
jgi:plasmid stability protein